MYGFCYLLSHQFTISKEIVQQWITKTDFYNQFMTEQKEMRLSLAAKKLNVGIVTIVEKLAVKGIRIENNPNAKLNAEQLNILSKEYNNISLFEDGAAPKSVEENKSSSGNSDILYFREQAKVEEKKIEPIIEKKPTILSEPEVIRVENKLQGVTILGKIDLDKSPLQQNL